MADNSTMSDSIQKSCSICSELVIANQSWEKVDQKLFRDLAQGDEARYIYEMKQWLKDKTRSKPIDPRNVSTFFKQASQRKLIECPYCQESACETCIMKWCLDSSKSLGCMYCKKGFTYEFQQLNFFKKNHQKIREHQSYLDFEREKALLPQIQEQIQKEAESAALTVKIRKYQDKIQALREEQYNLLNNQPKKKKKIEVTRSCPNSNCRGFLNRKWECGLCHDNFCKRCHDLLEDGHECDPDKVKSAELISKQCKNCPSCGAYIFKISGCPQMWCVNCNTAFDWNTGQIETGVIHNPHYFAYMRQTGQQILRPAANCGNQGLYRRLIIEEAAYYWIYEIQRLVLHNRQVELYKLETTIDKGNGDLGKKYLKQEIDEDKYKATLKRRYRIIERSKEYRDIFNTYNQCATDLLNSLPQRALNARLQDFEIQYLQLEKFTLEAFKSVGNRFKSSYPTINKDRYFTIKYKK